MPAHPEILWAQRSSDADEAKNIVYLTVNLPDIHPESLQYTVTSTGISFKATAGDKGNPKDFAFDLDLYDEVDPEKSSKRLTSRAFDAKLQKKIQKVEFWPRLTKEKLKTPYIKTNFEKWVDEDEQDGAAVEEENYDMGPMGGAGAGAGGFGGGFGGGDGMDFEKVKRAEASYCYMFIYKNFQMMAQMNAGGGPGGPLGTNPLDMNQDGDSDSDDGGPPPLENAEPSK